MVRIIVVLAVLAALAFLPTLWIRSVMRRHGRERPDIPRTGAEAARSMLDRLGLRGVKVERTDHGDHYDPEAKAVRLSENHMDKRSLAAVVVAAHEVGHAMQDATHYRPLTARTRLARQAAVIEKVGLALLLLAPVIMLVLQSRAALIFELILAAIVLGLPILMHIVTLPVEFDASFGRAIPLLRDGNFIRDHDLPAARQLLRAAAFTYVAAAIISLLNILRWRLRF